MGITTNETGIDPVTLSVVWRRLLTITSEIGYRVMHSAQSYVMGMVQDLGPQFISTEGEILTQVDFLPSHSLVAEIPSQPVPTTASRKAGTAPPSKSSARER